MHHFGNAGAVVHFNNNCTENAHMIEQTAVRGSWEEKLNLTVLGNGGSGRSKVSPQGSQRICELAKIGIKANSDQLT